MDIVTFFKHLFTVKKDIFDPRDHIVPPSVSEFPSSANAGDPFLPPVWNQGDIGSCTANAGTAYRMWLYKKFFQYEKDKTLAVNDFVLSRLFLYGQERIMEGDFTSDGGAQSRTMMKVLATTGCCLESELPYSDANLYTMPTLDQMASAKRFSGLSYHRVPDLTTLKSVIVSGYVATLGASVFESFESDAVANTGEVPVPTSFDKNIGGHETLIYAYDDTHKNLDKSLGALKIRNSWGIKWGINGDYWLPYNYLQTIGPEAYDLWILHLGKPWMPKKAVLVEQIYQ